VADAVIEARVAAEEFLLDHRTLARGYFRPRTLQRLLQHHATGQRDYSAWIWCLIVLEMWFRIFLDEPKIRVGQGAGA
jgi:hypothetical protein